MFTRLEPDSRRRRIVIAALVYAVCVVVFALVAGRQRLAEHTPFNHYALLADAWLHGRQDLAGGAPGYAMGNDFALFQGKTFISFPPFPALLMLPFVKLAGSPEGFQDGQFVVWLAGVGPAVLFLVLEKLRRDRRSPRSERENIVFSLLFAFGTVYFFTAVEGTVWFAAHVVGVGVAALFLLVTLDAERPLLAGIVLACAWTTRPTMLLMAPLFAFEALRACCKDPVADEGSMVAWVREALARVDRGALARKLALFTLPLLVSFAIASWMNKSRFGNPSPFAFGHEHLSVVWNARMQRWGLFGYHYLAKNLGVALTILPWTPPRGALADAPFKINEHGLALWFTSPFYLWLLWPKRRTPLGDAIALSALAALAMNLLYQNSGWRQFGYRFSNDYALLLFALLALGGRSFGWFFRGAAAWALAWNLFGAVTFDRGEYDRFYYRDGSQTVLYQPD